MVFTDRTIRESTDLRLTMNVKKPPFKLLLLTLLALLGGSVSLRQLDQVNLLVDVLISRIFSGFTIIFI